MTSLLNNLDSFSDKKPYQSYVLQHGIEKLSIRVPLNNVVIFEDRFASLADKTKTSILGLIVDVGGKLVE